MARSPILVDYMYSRLDLCEYTNLQNLLEGLLPHSISLLFEPTPHVVSKVIKILNLVHKRVKHNLEIGLPLLKLWILYLDAIDSDSPVEKVDMAGDFVAKIPKLPLQHQEKMLRILAEVMGESHSTQVNDEVARIYASIGASEGTRIFLEFCLLTVLYQPPQQGGGCPAGLSITQSERVTGKRPLKTSTLLMTKLGILNVVQAMELAPAVVFPLYVAACADWDS